jgi:cysteine-rich repeat protein
VLSQMRRFALTLAGVATALAACSDDERPARPPGIGAASGSSGRAGSAGAGATGGDASGGAAGSGGTAGSGGGRDGGGDSDGSSGSSGDGGTSGEDAGPAVCGNGIAEGSEGCDGTDLRQQTCASYGFESGSLACADCSVDVSGCVGTENCADGRDNDADQAVDCADADCKASCENACSVPVVLPDPASGIVGQTNDHSSVVASSCIPSGVQSGPEIVYRFTAARSGVLDVKLTSPGGADFSLSVRRTCADGASELGCAERIAGQDAVERLNVAITQGDAVFIVVDGTGASTGRYRLDALSRPLECGDSNRDTGEECDDGNRTPNDGCGSDCRIESDESEPNGTTGEADPYTPFPFVASIGPAGDVDVFSVTVSNANSTISAETLDLGDGSCSHLLLDSLVEILAPDGSVLASDNDSGPGYCSVTTAGGLAAGTYYVRVRSAAASATFPYRLNVAVMR